MSIKIKKIPLNYIFEKFPLQEGILKSYLQTRPDALEKTDIFFENCRSQNQKLKNFGLFQETDYDDDKTVYICPVYLELYEYAYGSTMVKEVIDSLSKQYHSNKVVFQWNHDKDFSVIEPPGSRYPNIWSRPKNTFIINFNTSDRHPNDIIVPFWVINTEWVEKPKLYTAGFIGSLNNGLRQTLANTISEKKGYIYRSGLSHDDFLKTSSRCFFSLCPRGQGLSSYRFYESFHLNTIPVLFADKSILPFSEEIDYHSISIPVIEQYAHNFEELDKIIKIKLLQWDEIMQEIKNIRHKFTLLGVQEEVHRRLL